LGRRNVKTPEQLKADAWAELDDAWFAMRKTRAYLDYLESLVNRREREESQTEGERKDREEESGWIEALES
jgi:hypothetical protein